MDHGMHEIAASMLRNLFLDWWKTSTSIREVANRAPQRRQFPRSRFSTWRIGDSLRSQDSLVPG